MPGPCRNCTQHGYECVLPKDKKEREQQYVCHRFSVKDRASLSPVDSYCFGSNNSKSLPLHNRQMERRPAPVLPLRLYR